MIFLKILIIVTLLVVFVQDIKSRSVYWFLFPALMGLFISVRLLRQGLFIEIWQPVLLNMTFLILQLLIVSVYFSIKNKHWINITTGLLGWGDILLLLSIACYLSVLNFLFFYMISLTGVLVIWLIWQLIAKQKNKQIPLAGIQSLIFAVFLATGWWCIPVNLTSDDWLLRLINK